jgi:hypothetical protein
MPRKLSPRACAWCDTVKPMKLGQRYCCRKCSAYGQKISRSEADIASIVRRASAAAAAKRAADVLARVQDMTTIEAYRYGRKLGYTDGYNSHAYKVRRRAA